MKNWTVIYIISDWCTRRKYIQHAIFFINYICSKGLALISHTAFDGFFLFFWFLLQVLNFFLFLNSFICTVLVGLGQPCDLSGIGFNLAIYTAICSSFSCKSATGFLSLFLKPISLSKARFSATTLCCFSCVALLLAVLWLLFLAAGTSWLCFPSYVVITALGSVEALSTCLRTLQPRLVHL